MSQRYEAVAVRKYRDRDDNEKTAFTNIGVAWPMKDRDGFSLRLHAIPAPVDGEIDIQSRSSASRASRLLSLP